ncbi:hypothetical protein [Devosia sp. DBB001]|nr:hypothetical protein [Devosia sp. DBB001]
MTHLTFAELRRVNVARCIEGWKHPLDSWTIPDWLVAIGGEVGEALNIVKKLNRERDGIIGNQKVASELLDDLADELADVVIYCDLTLARLDAPLSPKPAILTFEALAEFHRNILAETELVSASQHGMVMLETLGWACAAEDADQLPLSIRLLVGASETLAHALGIDLGAAVVAKFNATSDKHSFPHKLGAEVREGAL